MNTLDTHEKQKESKRISRDLCQPVADGILTALERELDQSWVIKMTDWEEWTPASTDWEFTISVRPSDPRGAGYAWIRISAFPDRYNRKPRKVTVKIEGSMDTKRFSPKTWSNAYTARVLDHVVPFLKRIKEDHKRSMVTLQIGEETAQNMTDLILASGEKGQSTNPYDGTVRFHSEYRNIDPLPRPDQPDAPDRVMSDTLTAKPYYDRVHLALDFTLAIDQIEDAMVFTKLVQAFNRGLLTDPDALDALLGRE